MKRINSKKYEEKALFGIDMTGMDKNYIKETSTLLRLAAAAYF